MGTAGRWAAPSGLARSADGPGTGAIGASTIPRDVGLWRLRHRTRDFLAAQERSSGASVIGTAGWSVPKGHADAFPASGSRLERYAQCLAAVAINIPFNRPHRVETYARWAASMPERFRFVVKLARTITHVRRLVRAEGLLCPCLGEVAGLGPKLGPLLIQLPPSLRFDPNASPGLLRAFRDIHAGSIVCEPRPARWFAPDVDTLLAERCITRVAADPATVPGDMSRAAGTSLRYEGLQGSPKTYHSTDPPSTLDALADRLRVGPGHGRECGCIFDKTAAFAAMGDALATRGRLRSHAPLSETPTPS